MSILTCAGKGERYVLYSPHKMTFAVLEPWLSRLYTEYETSQFLTVMLYCRLPTKAIGILSRQAWKQTSGNPSGQTLNYVE